MSAATRILLVEDDPTIGALLHDELGRADGVEVSWVRDGKSAREALPKGWDVVLLDLRLPDVEDESLLNEVLSAPDSPPVILLTAHGTVETAVRCLKLGAFDFLEKPCRLEKLEGTIAKAIRSRRLEDENAGYRHWLSNPVHDGEPVPAFMSDLSTLANNDLPVLILGPTGAGKEVAARSLHDASPRADQPFLVVDCAALKDELIESELFGHERGAFTGATQGRSGLVEMGRGGTVFLDEIGELGLDVQGKLLRLLEKGEYRRVGGRSWRHSSARWMAATHRDLEQWVASGEFRSDLFYRLNVLRLDVPPLSERRDEILPLARTFLIEIDRRLGRGSRAFEAQTEMALVEYDWPGNIRELRHVVERIAVLSPEEHLLHAALPKELTRPAPAPHPGGAGTGRAEVARPDVVHAESVAAGSAADDPNRPVNLANCPSLAQLEQEHIERVLMAHNGDKKEAARTLGISLATLYNKLGRYDS